MWKIFLGLSLIVAVAEAERETDVIGNYTKATPEAAPWIVSFQVAKNDSIFCGATLISSEPVEPVPGKEKDCTGWILTAASCVQDVSGVIATLGNFNLKTANENNTVRLDLPENLAAHQHFNHTLGKHGYDIALIPVTFTLNNSLGLPGDVPNCTEFPVLNILRTPINESDYPLVNASMLGWGLLQEDGPLPKELYNTTLPLQPDQDCTVAYGTDVFHSLNMTCAGTKGFGPCSFDTGGPLVCQYVKDEKYHESLCGIASMGHGCGRDGFPGIFTDVSNYTDWIDSGMNKAYVIDYAL